MTLETKKKIRFLKDENYFLFTKTRATIRLFYRDKNIFNSDYFHKMLTIGLHCTIVGAFALTRISLSLKYHIYNPIAL